VDVFRATYLSAIAGAVSLGFSNGVVAAEPEAVLPVDMLQAAAFDKQAAAMRARIAMKWKPSAYQGTILVRIRLKRDGTLDGSPQIMSPPSAAAEYPAAAESILRAVTLSQPFTMLGQQTYGRWKEMELEFAPEAEKSIARRQ
jgi:hypothetical protein